MLQGLPWEAPMQVTQPAVRQGGPWHSVSLLHPPTLLCQKLLNISREQKSSYKQHFFERVQRKKSGSTMEKGVQ